MTLLELIMSLMILGVALVSTVQLLATAARQRRSIHERRLALAEVANQAERIALLQWDEIVADKMTEWQPSAELADALPAARCSLRVSEKSGDAKARQVRIQVDWTNGAGQPVDPVGITVWKFAAENRP